MEAQTRNYVATSCITVLAYDIVLYFDEEVIYIWRSLWSIPKLLYVFCRYYPLIHLCVTLTFGTHQISQHVCQEYWWYYGFGGYVLIVPIISLIFFFRVWALYGNSWQMNALLSLMFLGEFVSEIVTTIHVTIPDARNAVSDSLTSNGLPGCDTKIWLDPHFNTFQTLAWVPFLANGGLLFLFMLFKLWTPLQKRRADREQVHYFELKSPILSSMFKDGILYFFIVFASGALLMLKDLIPSMNVFGGYFHLWFIVILSLSGARLILNLRRIATVEHSSGTSTPAFTTFAARNPNIESIATTSSSV
ncbi:hypothetical protein BDN70DRAFT_990192 [Pholiota conissans]|uniref:DUF6533 domain-containing protein n=1 Tax=Pholiota conissans TaxID=109636 RepID=A0A9P5Z8L9_9AGAR|nr:hypothetical protein BDN70DRAFT_990192 [Pholiota conissans]